VSDRPFCEEACWGFILCHVFLAPKSIQRTLSGIRKITPSGLSGKWSRRSKQEGEIPQTGTIDTGPLNLANLDYSLADPIVGTAVCHRNRHCASAYFNPQSIVNPLDRPSKPHPDSLTTIDPKPPSFPLGGERQNPHSTPDLAWFSGAIVEASGNESTDCNLPAHLNILPARTVARRVDL